MQNKKNISAGEPPKGFDIAVVGMSCWYPGASTLLENWENILTKRRQFRRILDQRLPLDQYHSPDAKTPDKTYGTTASFIDGFQFDWMKHRIPKPTFESTDIVQWLALEVALKAVEDSKITREVFTKNKTGVIVGNSLTGENGRALGLRMRWPYVERSLRAASAKNNLSQKETEALVSSMEPIFKSAFPPITEDTLAGNLSNTIAGRIANYLDLKGGAYAVDGACASSLLAITTAANSLMVGDFKFAIAGGVDISLDTFELIGFSKIGALAKKEMSVYDRRGSGFLPGEGSGFVVLRPLEDAVRDNNQIYAVLKGWGVSSDGKGGLTAPTKTGQSEALLQAYSRAGYEVTACDFIEGHGTGTSVGDKIELEGIALTMSQSANATARSCGMTSFKSVAGHTKAAAGVGAFIKAVTALNTRILPPLANSEEPNQVFNESAKMLYPIQWGEVRAEADILRCGISAMGFGGINSHVTLESYGGVLPHLRSHLSELQLLSSFEDSELFVFSAFNQEKMVSKLKTYQTEFLFCSEAELTDLASFLSTQTNTNEKFRVSLVARTPEQLQNAIAQVLETLHQSIGLGSTHKDANDLFWIGNAVEKNRIGFLFPGQGSQQINMARQIKERFSWAQELLTNAQGWLGEGSIQSKVYRPTDRAVDREQLDSWAKELAQTQVAQPAICLASLLWLKRLTSLGLKPVAVGGHSLGELTAFHCANALTEKELITLAGTRGRLMSASSDKAGIMATLNCSLTEAKKLFTDIQGYCVIANINSPSQIIISGDVEGVDCVLKIAEQHGIQNQKLRVSNAFHSKIVASAAQNLASESSIPEEVTQLSTQLFSCMNGQKITLGTKLKAHFSKQIIEQVNFIQLVEGISAECDFMIEVGPGQILSTLVSKINQNHGPVCMPVESHPRQQAAFKKVLGVAFISGVEIIWSELYKNRLIRPYVPPSKKLFLDNYCERPFPQSLLVPLPAEDTSIPLSLVQAPAQNRVARTSTAVSKIESLILKSVAEKTGFELNSINLEMRLLDDLNLDSIKAGSLVGAMINEIGVTVDLDPARFANSTLREIVVALAAGSEATSSEIQDNISLPMAVGANFATSIGAQNRSTNSDKKWPIAEIDTRKKLNRIISELQEIANGPDSSFSKISVVLEPSPVIEIAKSFTPKPLEKPLKVAPPISSANQNHEILMRLIGEKTGFEKDSIRLEMRLLDDLNLDSIKAGSIVGALIQESQIQIDLDPARFTNATIQEILDALSVNDSQPVKTAFVELAPISAPQKVDAAVNLAEMLFRLVSEKTGFAPESISMEMRLLDDLNLDSIKAGAIVGSLIQESKLQIDLDPARFTNATLHEIIDALSPAQLNTPTDRAKLELNSVQEVLLKTIKEVAGFDSHLLNLDQLLQQDLNFSDLQIAELIKKTSGYLAIPSRIDPETVRGLSISQLAKIFENIKNQPAEKGAHQDPDEIPKDSSFFQNSAWIRDFQVEYLPTPRNLKGGNTHRKALQWSSAKSIVVCENSSSSFITSLLHELRSEGSSVEVATLSELKNGTSKIDASFTHVFSVLPEEGFKNGAPDKNLKTLVEFLHSMTHIPVAEESLRRFTSLAFIQFGYGSFGEASQTLEFGQCGAKTIAETLHLERSDLNIRLIDISSGADHAQLSREVMNECCSHQAYEAVGFDAQLIRYTPALKVKDPSQYKARNISWTPQDVILVSGGAKGISAECALAIAKKWGVQLALVGSSRQSNDQPNEELNRNLARFTFEKIKFQYYSCDVTDLSAVKKLISSITSSLGPITGFVHGAGTNVPRKLDQTSSLDAMIEISPKVAGLLNLCSELERSPLKIVSAFTSILGIMSIQGNGWYAFSNEITNLILHNLHRRHPAIATVTMAYGMWDEVGMASKLGSAKRFQKKGVGLVSKAEGISRFMKLFEFNPGAQQTMIAGRLWENSGFRIRSIQKPKADRFLTKILTWTPGVEVLSRAHLTLETDLYLKDHCFNGSYLFPTVFGLEAMAEAAALVSGATEIDSACFEKIDLERPIVVDEKLGTEIEIYAQVSESLSHEGYQTIKVGIRNSQTGFKRDHFSAIVTLNPKLQLGKHPLEVSHSPMTIEPVRDIYESKILFHGPKYRRYVNFYKLTPEECVFTSRNESEDDCKGLCFSSEIAKPLILGDAFFRDSILQTGQLLALKTRTLPVKISKIEIAKILQVKVTRPVQFKLKSKTAQDFNYDSIVIDEDSNVLERFTGIDARIVKLFSADPSVEEFSQMFAPIDLDHPQTKINQQCDELGLAKPMFFIEAIKGLSQMAIRDRHIHENIFVRKSYETYAKLHSLPQLEIELVWLQTGRPILKHADGRQGMTQVSVSHSGDVCACVLSSEIVGCDIEKMQPKSQSEWRELLGNKRFEMFKKISLVEKSEDLVGYMLWTANEAIGKSFDSREFTVNLHSGPSRQSRFRGEFLDQAVTVVAFQMKHPDENEYYVSIACTKALTKIVQSLSPSVGAMTHWPVTSKDLGGTTGGLHFSHFFEKQELVRASTLDSALILDHAEIFVTQFSETHIWGDARVGDHIDVHFSMFRSPDNDYSFDQIFNWEKRSPGQNSEKIAMSKSRVCLAKIENECAVRFVKLPSALISQLDSPEQYIVSAADMRAKERFERGNLLYSCAPSKEAPLLKKRVISQTVFGSLSEPTHILNYILWQSQLRDELLKDAIKVSSFSLKNGFSCNRVSFQSLIDAFPSDEIEVDMSLISVWQNAVELRFDFYRQSSIGRTRVAVSQHEAHWVKRTSDGTIVGDQLPNDLIFMLVNLSKQ